MPGLRNSLSSFIFIEQHHQLPDHIDQTQQSYR